MAIKVRAGRRKHTKKEGWLKPLGRNKGACSGTHPSTRLHTCHRDNLPHCQFIFHAAAGQSRVLLEGLQSPQQDVFVRREAP